MFKGTGTIMIFQMMKYRFLFTLQDAMLCPNQQPNSAQKQSKLNFGENNKISSPNFKSFFLNFSTLCAAATLATQQNT